jgi:hypothetical protein
LLAVALRLDIDKDGALPTWPDIVLRRSLATMAPGDGRHSRRRSDMYLGEASPDSPLHCRTPAGRAVRAVRLPSLRAAQTDVLRAALHAGRAPAGHDSPRHATSTADGARVGSTWPAAPAAAGWLHLRSKGGRGGTCSPALRLEPPPRHACRCSTAAPPPDRAARAVA